MRSRDWRELTLGDITHAVTRYRALACVLAGVLALAFLAPGDRTLPSLGDAITAPTAQQAAPAQQGVAAAAPQDIGGTAGPAQAETAPVARGSVEAVKVTPLKPLVQDALSAPDCDAVTKRIRTPSIFAAPCVALFAKGADNGGTTARGVTRDTILVAIRFSDPNPAVQAAIIAAGAEDTAEDVRATRQAWIDVFQAHYETYGRKVKIEYLKSSGSDDQAQRADAVKVANEIKAFAAWGGSGAYADELIARGVLCLCDVASLKYQLDRAPLLWGAPPENKFLQVAEYIGKKVWDRNARFAGDPIYQTQKRKLGLVYIDNQAGDGKAAVDFLEREMAKYGARLTDKISYLGDINTAQEQSRTIIAKLKDRGITSVMHTGDALAPVFFTQEATRQVYRPEWIITGGSLTDTTFFGRTRDPAQWEHAFGHSQLWARAPQVQDEVYNLHVWHFGTPPRAKATYEIIYQSPFVFFTAVHLAGPRLTAQSYRDALFSYPPSGGGPTSLLRSWGRHGFWPWEDYATTDDSTEVWWDPNAVGDNEIGQQGKGMWRYVDGGRRYRPGQWPAGESKLFDPAGTITKYEKLPAIDQYPAYEHKHYRS